MSGLLQRLAAQALGASGGREAVSRVRPAASAHAQVSLDAPVESDQVVSALQQFTAAATVDTGDSLRTRPAAVIGRHENPERGASHDATDRDHGPASIAPLSHGQPQAIPAARMPPSSAQPPRQPPQTFESRAPQPLLDEPQAGPPAAPTIAPIAPPRIAIDAAQTRAASEPTEVHVHIGRIEVTAVHEAAAPKKPRATVARNTLPLGDYLARRRRS